MWDKVFMKEFNRKEPIYNTMEDTIKAACISAAMSFTSKKFYDNNTNR